MRLLERLGAERGLSIAALTTGSGMTRQAVTRHLGVLARAGLVREETRGREHVFQLDSAPIRDVDAWVEGYRQFWEHSFDRLEALLQTTDSTPTPGSDP